MARLRRLREDLMGLCCFLSSKDKLLALNSVGLINFAGRNEVASKVDERILDEED